MRRLERSTFSPTVMCRLAKIFDVLEIVEVGNVRGLTFMDLRSDRKRADVPYNVTLKRNG